MYSYVVYETTEKHDGDILIKYRKFCPFTRDIDILPKRFGRDSYLNVRIVISTRDKKYPFNYYGGRNV